MPPDLEAVLLGAGEVRGARVDVPLAVTIDAKGKLHLPPLPAGEDPAACCAWLTAALALDPRHPVTAARHEGLRGAAGHAVLARHDAPPLRFEPAARINTPMRLVEDRTWQAIPSDGPVPPYKAEHSRQIAHVVRQLCGVSRAQTDEQETAGIVATFLQVATMAEGYTTYGTSAQRYEAARALGRHAQDGHADPYPRYLRDSQTGEIVIAVGDLADTARRHVGSSLPRGWLDARMEGLGWQRVRLDGHAEPGRAGRSSHHATVIGYRGHLPHEPESDQAVTK